MFSRALFLRLKMHGFMATPRGSEASFDQQLVANRNPDNPREAIAFVRSSPPLSQFTTCVEIGKRPAARDHSARHNLKLLTTFKKEKIMSKVSPIPQGYHSITPYLVIQGAAQAIDYYKKVFGATEVVRMDAPGGKIAHAELQIGDSRFMLADENPNMGQGYSSATTIGASPVSLYLYMPDVDRVLERAVAAGAKILKPVQDQFYGDRSGFIKDPFGHLWGIATHVEDVSPEEMKERMKKAMPAA
jgi:PhnB protein